MIDGIRIKVCGLTSLVDADFADRCGVDYLGFNLYPKSPRCISLETFRAMAGHLPDRKKVAVVVEPTIGELALLGDAGFAFFQIHFRHDFPLGTITSWSTMVGADRLWLAPKLPAPMDVAPELLPLAKHFLLDTFHADKFGGTGATGDWAKFARHRQTHPEKIWMLSGGLNADNLGEALVQSGARFVDVNSGVEAAPGVKDHARLKHLIVRLHEAATRACISSGGQGPTTARE